MTEMICTYRHIFSYIYTFTNISQFRLTMILGYMVRYFRIAYSKDPKKPIQNAFKVFKESKGFQTREKVLVISDLLAVSGKIYTVQI